MLLLPQDNFARNSDNGAFEEQYKKLLAEIQQIYDTAKEFHGKVCSSSSSSLHPCSACALASSILCQTAVHVVFKHPDVQHISQH